MTKRGDSNLGSVVLVWFLVLEAIVGNVRRGRTSPTSAHWVRVRGLCRQGVSESAVGSSRVPCCLRMHCGRYGEELVQYQHGAVARGRFTVARLKYGESKSDLAERDVRVRVMRRLPSNILIGRRFMLLYGMVLDLRAGMGVHYVPGLDGEIEYSGNSLHDGSDADYEQLQYVHEAVFEDAVASRDVEQFRSEEEKAEVYALLLEYGDSFSPKTSTAPGYEFGIALEDGADLNKLNRRSFPKSRQESELETAEVKNLLERGILVPSMSSCSTKNVFVAKRKLLKGSSVEFRFTSDFRALNSVTKNNAYPTEDVKSVVRWLATNRVYSVADLKDGHWNYNLRESDRYLTAVRTVLGLFEYAMMAQGLKGASALFQKMVNEVYMGLRLTGQERC